MIIYLCPKKGAYIFRNTYWNISMWNDTMKVIQGEEKGWEIQMRQDSLGNKNNWSWVMGT